MINLIISFIAFFGLIIGWFIAKKTKEELKEGRKYFNWLHKFLVLVFIGSLIYFDFNIYLLALGVLVGYFIRRSYLYLGLVSFGFFNYFIFLFGLSYSSLEKYSNKKLILCLIFFVVGVVIANIYKGSFYYSFVSGALLWRLLDAVPDKFRII